MNHKIFFINGLWLFTTSFIPLSTAWIGKNLFARGPEIFYGIIFFIWSASFLMLVQMVINENKRLGRSKHIEALKDMQIYKYLTNPAALLIQMIIWILLLIFAPQFQLVIMIWQIMFVASKTNIEIDHRNNKYK